jgi:urate oxidase / 2-oxo-4-hydroxy-4-carboxy-5-ureidoimidazoline decarboxylase
VAEPVAIGYGKEAVSVYRTDGVRSLFAASIGMTARGPAFLPSYTEGDNTVVVATDSMKNFIQVTALEYEGTSLEDFLELLARRFLATYPQVERIEVTGRELPFARRTEHSFQGLDGDRAVAELSLDRSGALEHRSGREGIRLVKLTGSSFAGFVRDEYTTLPEAHDRPLFVHMNVGWTNADLSRAAPCEDVRDVAVSTFCDVRSASIQELVHQIGVRVLGSFEQIAAVDFYAENRLWDTAQTGDDAVVYTDARPPFGVITLTLER